LSAIDEIDRDQVSTITPSKRTRASLLTGNQNDEVQDLIGSKFSATKMSKQPNITKHPKIVIYVGYKWCNLNIQSFSSGIYFIKHA
jgi:hypothetical protein